MLFIITLIGIIFIIATVFTINSDDFKEKNNAPTINKESLQLLINEVDPKGTKFISHNNSGASYLNKEISKLYIFYSIGQNHNKIHSYKYRIVDFNDILASEIIIDNNTVTSTARGSQLAGVVAGGALLGGVGTIIGGLSGKTNSVDQIKKIDIKLTINDMDNPICNINFLDGDDKDHRKMKHGFKKDSTEYNQAISEVEKWQGIFDVILNERQQAKSATQ